MFGPLIMHNDIINKSTPWVKDAFSEVVVVSEMIAYYLHGVHRYLSSLEVWRQIVNNIIIIITGLVDF